MEEARRVLARLERIDALECSLLEELRALLYEAEDWVRAERDVPESAVDAVARGREMLQGTSRTLLA
jgi:hypothetical protein